MSIEGFVKIISSLIIPGDEKKGLLSGSEVNFYKYLESNDKLDSLIQYLELIRSNYRAEFHKELLDCTEEEIKFHIIKGRRKNFRFLNDISVLLCECYYSDSCALQRLGLPSDAPFPEGNIINEIDLTLLEGVYNKGKIYRQS